MNDGEDQRCTRCGRRLRMAAPRSAPDTYPMSNGAATATAPAFERLSREMPVSAPPPERPTYQPSLFRDPMGSPRVIPIPMLTPLRAPDTEAPPSRRSPARSAPPRVRRAPDSQQALEFREGDNAPAGTHADLIYCDAPVALPAHRMIAAVVDTSAVLLGLGIFLGIFFLSGGDMVLNRQTVPFLIGVTAVISVFYRFLWCLANGDTPGMRCAGLRLVDFDGRRPDREQRGVRQVAGMLSLLSAGLGLVWALVDEESLTWHDHISKTFPTPGS
jgi:uncharacterized RDD family membrane protein YckC